MKAAVRQGGFGSESLAQLPRKNDPQLIETADHFAALGLDGGGQWLLGNAVDKGRDRTVRGWP
jgi:hypothetical protein